MHCKKNINVEQNKLKTYYISINNSAVTQKLRRFGSLRVFTRNFIIVKIIHR